MRLNMIASTINEYLNRTQTDDVLLRYLYAGLFNLSNTLEVNTQ